jgi:2-polyprenyl-3-methyl-5-hydroxy-6-metoxy-1,4-benzoquinol methylase
MIQHLKKAVKWAKKNLVKNSGERWDYKYEKGDWKWLKDVTELAHYSILAGYFQYLKKGGSILEIGCGEGLLQERIASSQYSKYVGIDISEAAIKIASVKEDEKTTFIAVDMNKYVPTEKFDAIIFNESLYYVMNPAAVLIRYGAYLKPRGVFILSNFLNQDQKLPWSKMESVYPKYDETKITNARGDSCVCRVLIQPS